MNKFPSYNRRMVPVAYTSNTEQQMHSKDLIYIRGKFKQNIAPEKMRRLILPILWRLNQVEPC